MDQAINEKMRKMAAITALAANYDSVMPKELTKMWLNLLAEYSAEEVELGVNKVASEYEYKTRPPFAVLRKAIDEITGKQKIDPEEQLELEAESEWDLLIDAIRIRGRYKPPVDLDPTTEYVLRSFGGWLSACNWESATIDWKRKEFIDRWKLAHGKESYMERGAGGIFELVQSRNIGNKKALSIAD